MEDWQEEALSLALELCEHGEVRIESGGEDYVFAVADVIALGLMVLCAGPGRTGEVVCSWLDRARVASARPMGDA
jgi:hypothetical protein